MALERRGYEDMNSGREISPDLIRTPVRKLNKHRIPPKPSQVVSSTCSVCQHDYRSFLETQLVLGSSFKSLEDQIAPRVSRQALKNHLEKHMDLQDAAMRAVIEHSATVAGVNEEIGVRGILTARGALEAALQRGHQAIVDKTSRVEAKDLVQIARTLGEMDKNSSQVAVDELHNQFQIFMQAIRDVCDVETQNAIGARVGELREDPLFEGYNGPQEVVVDAEVVPIAELPEANE